MSEHPDLPPATGASGASDEILAVLAAEEPHGATADHVAWALGLTGDGMQVQETLEELVEWGVVDRRGIGARAVYTLNPAATPPA